MGRRYSQQERDEVHGQIKDNITEIVNQAAEEVMLKKQQSPVEQHDVERVLNELERDLVEKCNFAASAIEVNADVHETSWQGDGDDDSDENGSATSQSPIPPTDSNQSGDSKIPLPAGKTSTPIKVRTIKKHSKVNRELTSKPGTTIRPAVEDIEWDIGNGGQQPVIEETIVNTTTTTIETTPVASKASKIPKSKGRSSMQDVGIDEQTHIDVISTANLENVVRIDSTDEELDDQEPENLIITGHVDDGEQAMLYDDDDDIDEVILVQTPGSDFAPDSEEFSVRESRIGTRTISKATVKDGEIIEEITVITEEHLPNGQVIVRKEEHQTKRTASNSGTTSSSGHDDASRDLITTNTNNSLSINSESDSDSRGGSPYQMVRPSTGSGTTKSTTTGRTLGSSSGSDVALHEAGGELSDDEPGTHILTHIQLNTHKM